MRKDKLSIFGIRIVDISEIDFNFLLNECKWYFTQRKIIRHAVRKGFNMNISNDPFYLKQTVFYYNVITGILSARATFVTLIIIIYLLLLKTEYEDIIITLDFEPLSTDCNYGFFKKDIH